MASPAAVDLVEESRQPPLQDAPQPEPALAEAQQWIEVLCQSSKMRDHLLVFLILCKLFLSSTILTINSVLTYDDHFQGFSGRELKSFRRRIRKLK